MQHLTENHAKAAARAGASGFVRFDKDVEEEDAIKSSVATININDEHSTQSNEFQRLLKEDAATATRIEWLELTPSERDILCLSIRKMNDLGSWAETYSQRMPRLFATQVMCSAGVPVLIALLGSFESYYGDLTLRLVAIGLSILGTACHAVDDAYDWRSQASIRRRYLTRMRLLFDNFCVLSGAHFDPARTGANANSFVPPMRRTRAMAGIDGCFAATPYTSAAHGSSSSSDAKMSSALVPSIGPNSLSPPHPQAQLAAALDELRARHSGDNFRRYLVAFSALEDECSAALTALHHERRAAS